MTTPTDEEKRPAGTLAGSPCDENLRLHAEQVVRSNGDDGLVVSACSYIVDMYPQDPTLDREIMEALRRVLRRGLTFTEDSSDFLTTSRIMAQLCFKYQSYREASNWLLFLRDLTPAGQPGLPAWALLYSAKLAYVLDPLEALYRPAAFFNYVAGALDVLGSTEDTQCHGVVAEFLDTVLQRVEEDYAMSTCLPGIFGRLNQVSQKHGGVFDKEARGSILRFFTSGGLERASDALIQSSTPSDAAEFLRLISLEVRSHLEEQLEQLPAHDTASATVNTNEGLLGSGACQPAPAGASYARKPRILVLAGSVLRDSDIIRAAAQCGVEKDQLELHTDYIKNKRFQLDTLRYNSRFDGILIGPEAHKVADVGDSTSVLDKLEHEDGYPPCVAIRTKSGTLRVTATGLKDALNSLLAKVSGNYPSSAASGHGFVQ
jgi:hypothetical protein